MQNGLRSSFLAPFPADRATAVSDIIVRIAVDDLRQKTAAAAHGMSVYVWSAFLAGTRFRAKIAPWVARFGRGLPGQHGVHARGFAGCVECRGASYGAPQAALGIEGSCATRAFTAPIFRFSPRGASRGYEPWPLEPMAAAATSRTSKPQNDGISIIRAGRGKTLASTPSANLTRGSFLACTVQVR